MVGNSQSLSRKYETTECFARTALVAASDFVEDGFLRVVGRVYQGLSEEAPLHAITGASKFPAPDEAATSIVVRVGTAHEICVNQVFGHVSSVGGQIDHVPLVEAGRFCPL